MSKILQSVVLLLVFGVLIKARLNPDRFSSLSISKRLVPPRISFVCGKQGRIRVNKPIVFLQRRSISRKLTQRSKRSSKLVKSNLKLDGPLIVGGHTSIRSSWPWMALLGRKRERKINYFCDGVLVNEQFVLTAAHCVLEPTPFFVRLGEHDYNSNNDHANPYNVEVQKITFHPKYKLDQGHHDLALIKLKTKVTIKNDVRPVCLPWRTTSNAGLVGKYVKVTGWGQTSFGGLPSPVLQEVGIRVFNSDRCHRSYSALSNFKSTFPKGLTTENILCAGVEGGGKDSCQGDSGGPLVRRGRSKWTLAGIVSKGFGCGSKDFPGLYTPIRNIEHLQWIKDIAFA